jgi:enoyl-CoA hydratase/carnithine racemase
MSETEKVLLVERQGPIAIVTLNRPDKRNALSEKLWGELKRISNPTCVASCSPAPANTSAPG